MLDELPTGGPVVAPSLLDPKLDAELDEVGYAILPALDGETVRRLALRASELYPEPRAGFDAGFEHDDPSLKVRVAEVLEPVWEAAVLPHLVDHRVVFTSFLLKWPGEGSGLALHQDWSYVDESQFRSLAVWVPLVDTSPEADNGPLHVLPGSHRWASALRGTRTDPWFGRHRDYVTRHLVPLSVKAGQVVVMDNRVLHASFDNRSGVLRPVAAACVAPARAGLRHVFAEGDRFDIVEVEADFFVQHGPRDLAMARPEGLRLIEQVGPHPPTPDGDIAAACGRRRPPPPERPSLLAGSASPSGEGDKLVDRLLVRALRLNHDAVVTQTGAGPLLRDEAAGWVDLLEREWKVFRDDFDGMIAEGISPVRHDDLLDMPEEYTSPGWELLGLVDRFGPLSDVAARCSRSMELLAEVPGLLQASFSVFRPGTYVAPHRGANNGVMRGLLGLHVPRPSGSCGLQVADLRLDPDEGVCLVFDDTYEHAAWNDGDTDRVQLLLEVQRPLVGPTRTVNSLVQAGYRRHRWTRMGHSRYLELYRAVNH